jgi:hypothetical protein
MRSLLAAALVVCTGPVAAAGWWDDAGTAHPVSLAEVLRAPDALRDVTVSLDVRLAGSADRTHADSEEFTRVLVAEGGRGGEAARSAETAPVVARCGSFAERRLATLRRGQSAHLVAVVRDAPGGAPRIEVLAVVADGDPLTPEETAELARADKFLARDNPAAAEETYRALVARRALPRATLAEVHRKIGAACWSRSRFAAAVESLSAALAIEPEDRDCAAKLAAAREALAARAKKAPDISSPPPASLPPAPGLLPPAGLDSAPTQTQPPAPAAATVKVPLPVAPPVAAVAPPPRTDEPPPVAAPAPALSGPR